jgi:hypothetical protein
MQDADRRPFEGQAGTLSVLSSEEGRPIAVKRWKRHPRCVPLARRELREQMSAWGMGEIGDTAVVILSELLTNAVQHARAPWDRLIETRYECLPDGELRIEVHDANESRPQRKEPSTDGDSGRGLALVDALTRGRWGVSDRVGPGKLVWAVCADDATREVIR